MPPDVPLLHQRNGVRRWRVWFGGDPEYGRAPVGEYLNQAEVVEAVDGSSAARKVIGEWRRHEAHYVKEEGWYDDGTVLYVQEVVEAPPIKVFIRENGRMKLERS